MRMAYKLLPLIAALAYAPAARAQDAGFKVVVHAANPISAIARDELSRLFLKKSTRWARGGPVTLVDQSTTSPIRNAFTKGVHKREVGSIQSYWQRMIFSGRGVPPAEKRSDADVLAFVASTPGAIGYVAATTATTGQVKVIAVE